jgi:hypothetical protein
MRKPLGRTRPDLAALISFDDGPLTFSKTYSSGSVGPFAIGESRAAVARRISKLPFLDQDKQQLVGRSPTWRFALPLPSGGYAIYTLNFENDRIASAKSFYSVFAGL